ncbi:MAG TPA: MerR family transcriptional regulator [Vicinamibacterales bacterium]|nr:MerR family transcriptional regulator [Vicinamibacterales bacterium]
MRLKKSYSAREVAALTGLSARQLRWWEARGVVSPLVAPRRTPAGGYTERRYSPVELIELLTLADLRRRGVSFAAIRRLIGVLRERFQMRLYDALGGGGRLTLLTDGRRIYGRTAGGDVFDLLRSPEQPLLVVGDGALRELRARARRRRARRRGAGRSAART